MRQPTDDVIDATIEPGRVWLRLVIDHELSGITGIALGRELYAGEHALFMAHEDEG